MLLDRIKVIDLCCASFRAICRVMCLILHLAFGRSQVQELGGVVFQLCRTIQTPVNSISLSERER